MAVEKKAAKKWPMEKRPKENKEKIIIWRVIFRQVFFFVRIVNLCENFFCDLVNVRKIFLRLGAVH